MRAEEGQGRRRSNEELLTTDGAQQIVAVSDTLSYKKVGKRAKYGLIISVESHKKKVKITVHWGRQVSIPFR